MLCSSLLQNTGPRGEVQAAQKAEVAKEEAKEVEEVAKEEGEPASQVAGIRVAVLDTSQVLMNQEIAQATMEATQLRPMKKHRLQLLK